MASYDSTSTGRLVSKSEPFNADDTDLTIKQPPKIGFGEQDFFSARIREVRLYQRALTDREIATMQEFHRHLPTADAHRRSVQSWFSQSCRRWFIPVYWWCGFGVAELDSLFPVVHTQNQVRRHRRRSTETRSSEEFAAVMRVPAQSAALGLRDQCQPFDTARGICTVSHRFTLGLRRRLFRDIGATKVCRSMSVAWCAAHFCLLRRQPTVVEAGARGSRMA